MSYQRLRETPSTSDKTTSRSPLSADEVAEYRQYFGFNRIDTGQQKPWYNILFTAIVHPFNLLLLILAAGSAGTGDLDTMTIMLIMVTISSIIRFQQEWKSYREALSLLSLVSKKIRVIRYQTSDKTLQPDEMFIETEELVPGDWVKLEPGNLISADMCVIQSKNLYISQASLTGEAIPVEKYAINTNVANESEVVINIPNSEISNRRKIPRNCKKSCKKFFKSLFGFQINLETADEVEEIRAKMKENLDRPDMCYMGTSVVTGTATVVVNAIGSQTYFGVMADKLAKAVPQNAFQLGVRRISWIFFLTMTCMVPPVLLLQGFLQKDWKAATLFALSVAVGLTPEMLPMIVNITLAKSAYQMAIRKCVVKSLDAVVNLGGMNILCTDKTGTLTKSIVTLDKYIDLSERRSEMTLYLAYMNSYFQSVQRNPMDSAIVCYCDTIKSQDLAQDSSFVSGYFDVSGIDKVDEISFDFSRRRMSVVLKEKEGDPEEMFLICKGATEEMLNVCTKIVDQANMSTNTINDVREGNFISEITDETLSALRDLSERLNEDGLRVLAVAYKNLHNCSQINFDSSYENDLIFVGFVAFSDPPKLSAKIVIKNLLDHNVKVKVLTGDSSKVCRKICQEIELPVESIVTSADLANLDDGQVSELADRGTIFSKLTPIQKADIVRALKRNGHIVGFLGDGINDAPALLEADVGISVDSATDIAKESADIILLEKDLSVVGDGVTIGRLTFGNSLKYIVMAVSSNFGNGFSVLAASSWLPFLPMLPIHILVQNLLYDISQITIPWDHMDKEFLAVPHRWSMKMVLKFMICMGLFSSVFDITTFLYMFYYYGIQTEQDDVLLFQTTWFTENLLTQTLIVHIIRTRKIPFFQSCASFPVTTMTILISAIAIAIPFTPGLRDWLQMKQLDVMVFPYIAGALLSYAISAQVAKIIYVKIFKDWF